MARYTFLRVLTRIISFQKKKRGKTILKRFISFGCSAAAFSPRVSPSVALVFVVFVLFSMFFPSFCSFWCFFCAPLAFGLLWFLRAGRRNFARLFCASGDRQKSVFVGGLDLARSGFRLFSSPRGRRRTVPCTAVCTPCFWFLCALCCKYRQYSFVWGTRDKIYKDRQNNGDGKKPFHALLNLN